ncbi:hypothetical protein [Mesorhizobium sp.]|uniref:hypothetical protein n=1 Tax=Mesorhizobium sp. TaxID=1871066 RepID=UPI000FE4BE9E|nr:hypothetical protein [Mesorhizobium sp.]RWM29789.1 MAG: hypothetical protein EOR75_31925 [Mesorhizobium sp.]TJV47687.1 MAG: hypothetical protein E5Y01_31780 [Mesorhizobium sp.]
MNSSMSISRRALLGGLAAAVVTPAPAKPVGEVAGALPQLDTVPAWRGPGFYEVGRPGARRVFFIEQTPTRPGRWGIWFQASESMADRANGGIWSMPAESLAFQDIRKVETPALYGGEAGG